MPDLKNYLLRFRNLDQILRVFKGRRHRLFNQHVNAAFQALSGDPMMKRRGNSDADRINLTEQILKMREGPATVLGGNGMRTAVVRIDDRNEVRLRDVGVEPGMVLP